MLSCWRLSVSFLLLAHVQSAMGMLYAHEIIEKYDHKGGVRVTKEIFAEDLNIMKNLAKNCFQATVAIRRAENDKYLGLILNV